MTVVAVWWRQERIAYQPPADNPAPPIDVGRVVYTASDGQRLYSYVVEPPVGGASPPGVLVAFHGTADLAIWQIPWGREVAERPGWYVVLAEYRGYGGLSGAPHYEGVRRDARAAWNYVRAHIATPSRAIAVFGHSLGSAVAVELAAELARESSTPLPASLLLQSPFTSAREMARIVSTRPVHLLWNFISRVHYDTRTKLAGLDTSVWIAHGVQDWLVPDSMGRELHCGARRPGRLLLVSDAGHNDVDGRGGTAYWQWLADALAEAVRAHAALIPAAQSESRRHTGTSG
jgi:pimeloyl-ACP methyl ester carboxylesterase